jgi:hemerythrin-like metal-binding protein
MEKFVWTPEYSLDIGIIDEQHQHFFGIVNEIYDILEANKSDSAELIKVINELRDYAFYHLSTEEKYFNQFAYSDIANHMEYHMMFREQSDKYFERINSGNEDLPKLALEITDFAKNWLMKHILVADKMYAPLFKEHGIE